MENFYTEMAELLEADEVKESDNLRDFECWDSLTILSIIASVSGKYGVVLFAQEIEDSKTVGGLLSLIESKKV